MSDIETNLSAMLIQASYRLHEAGVPDMLAQELERLGGQVVNQPCVVAVVGRVKAGKSTFINAFLEDDLAKTGTTETTATINYFCYGQPPTADKPVRCYWRTGQYTYVDRGFLDSLQSNTIEALRRADGIDHLDYFLPNPVLHHVTLVDTPGTEAVVEEHQNRTAEFMNLYGQLRERHNQQTQRIGSDADAVIYLIGQVPYTSDRDFLEEFRQTTRGQSRALNAIGVMAKIDLYPDLIERRIELAAKIADQLKESLNTVVPVSGGLQRALQHLCEQNQAGLRRLMSALRQIPPARLGKLLDNDRFYREFDFPDCPIGVAQRNELLGDMPWRVFTTIAQLAANPVLTTEAIVLALETIAGFGPLKAVLERHFFKRSQILRCYRTISNARQVLNTIRYQHLPAFRQRDADDLHRLGRFVQFIRQANGDLATARELEAFVQNSVVGRATKLEIAVTEVDRAFSRMFHDIEQYNADFGTVQHIEEHTDLFTPSERDELFALHGLYGLDADKRLPAGRRTVEYVQERQQLWRQVSMQDRSAVRRTAAQQAVLRYGLILDEMARSAAPSGPPQSIWSTGHLL